MLASPKADDGNLNDSIEDESAPRRAIFNDEDMRAFLDSPTRKELLRFVESMGRACATAAPMGGGSEVTAQSNDIREQVGSDDPYFSSLPSSMACLHGALRQMSTWIDEIPPVAQADSDETIRFGNPAFKTWHRRLVHRSSDIVSAVIKCKESGNKGNISMSNEEASRLGWAAAGTEGEANNDKSLIRVSCYLHDAFGHPVRLDYGTGHETAFVVFLLVLSKLGCFGSSPDVPAVKAVALSVFNRYLDVSRRLQDVYRLEPAGSHGVWGLDDYYCLAFYFGACQLSQPGGAVPNELSQPLCIQDNRLLEDHHSQFMYLASIRYIQHIKRNVPFFESSPMLYDISQSMPSWQKLARGLLRLYEGEVLGKRPVVQHLLFSPKLFEANWTPSRTTGLVAPTTTFRGGGVTKAPWAVGVVGVGAMSATRAPWSRGGIDASVSGGGASQTRAPRASNRSPGSSPPFGLDNSETL